MTSAIPWMTTGPGAWCHRTQSSIAVYDVVALPGIVRPSMIGFRSDEVRRTISNEG